VARGSMIGGGPAIAPPKQPQIVIYKPNVKAAEQMSEEDEEQLLKESKRLDHTRKQMDVDQQLTRLVASLVKMEAAFKAQHEEKLKLQEEVEKLRQELEDHVVSFDSAPPPPPPMAFVSSPQLHKTQSEVPQLQKSQSEALLGQIREGHKLRIIDVELEKQKLKEKPRTLPPPPPGSPAMAPPPEAIYDSLRDTLTAAMEVRKLAMHNSDDETDSDWDEQWDDGSDGNADRDEFQDDDDSVFDF